MKKLKSYELRNLYLDFFKSKGHKIIFSGSLIPDEKSNVLYTNSGMLPLIEYFSGEKEIEYSRIANVQKVIRTGAIDSVGNDLFCTFFEVFGNWSFGDYYKEDAIAYAWEFLTSESYLNIEKGKLYITCFDGNELVPKDLISYRQWINQGVEPSHIYNFQNNWKGPYGNSGICGPNTKIFYDTGKERCGSDCNPLCKCNKFIEIWDNVFFEYSLVGKNEIKLLEQKSVDTGMGLDRLLAIINEVQSLYDTDLFEDVIRKLEELSNYNYIENKQNFRIISDHLRAITFILGDAKNVYPSSNGRGYILRRLIRRVYRTLSIFNLGVDAMKQISDVIINQYSDIYPELLEKREFTITQLEKEVDKYKLVLKRGMTIAETLFSNFSNITQIDGVTAFTIYERYGLPIEVLQELAEERGKVIEMDEFNERYKHHQESSRMGGKSKIKIITE